ncbi:MAG: UDP-N-acetylglucosamine pyrophosphorylase [Lachnospiraceae bacterium]|nr:UDP-N-acetylglucosamine pyrophosphorylase [Lachnospiraceae bacterium]
MYEQLKSGNLLDFSQTVAKSLFERAVYPWEAFENLSQYIMELGATLPSDKFDKIGEDIWIAKTATVAPSAYIHGPLIICDDTEVRHCAFIRGTSIVGERCVVGNSTELKGSILFNNVQVPHYNYIGDSILGYKAHTGAGTITSNLKSDRSLVTVSVDGDKFATYRKKFGAIIGDNTEVGCNSVLNPGTVLGRNTVVYPLSMVRGYVPENTIYKNAGEVCEKFPENHIINC